MQTIDQVFVQASASEGRNVSSRRTDRLDGDPSCRPDDGRRREGRYYRRRPNRGGHPPLHKPSALQKAALHPACVGHYGIFNGSRYRQETLPRVIAFMAEHDIRGGALRWLWHRLAGERDVAAPPVPLLPEERIAEPVVQAEMITSVRLASKGIDQIEKGRRSAGFRALRQRLHRPQPRPLGLALVQGAP